MDISSAIARSAIDLSKTLVVLSDATARRPAVIEKTWNHNENQKKVTFLEVIKESIIYKFSKDFTNQRKEANIPIDLRPLDTVDLFPTFLNKGSTDEFFEQSGNQNSFRHILKNSVLIFNTIRTMRLWWIKVRYDLCNQRGSYKSIMQFQISSNMENR